MNRYIKEKINMISSDKIHFFRKQNNYIIEKLAEELNMESRTYFNKAKGKTEFTATEIWMLTVLLNCSLDDLIKETDEMNDLEKSKFDKVLSLENGKEFNSEEDIKIIDSLEYSLEDLKIMKSKDKNFKFNIMSGKKIKHYMNLNNITTDEISMYLGKQRRAFFNKIKGDTEFTATEVWILTKIFGCKFEDLTKDLI